MKITTIRVTEKQLEWIRQNHPQNLSRIVREHLDDLMHRATPVNFHNSWRENAQKCYPFMSDGYCYECWPAGVPSKSQWNNYIREGQRVVGGQIVSNLTWDEWLVIAHNNRQTTLENWNLSNANQISHQESSETVPDDANIQNRGLRAFLRWIFGLQT